MANLSLEDVRLTYRPILPKHLESLERLSFQSGEKTSSRENGEEVQRSFPHLFGQPVLYGKIGGVGTKKALVVGVVFSGGQAAGGHNVIGGLFDALKAYHREAKLYGFLGGPKGIIEGEFREICEEELKRYRNLGGFDLIGSGREKIETKEHLEQAKKRVTSLGLDGLVIVGGDDSNTNAAWLAEFFTQQELKTKVIGVPKTIDGDLKNPFVEISFGFDTACRTYSEMIGNIARDALSAKKYVHFIKLMGRSASHIALECALQTHPTYTLIGEEIAAKQQTLSQIVEQLATVVANRSPFYGVLLIPEGIIEFIPEMKKLLTELNRLLSDSQVEDLGLPDRLSLMKSSLDPTLYKTFALLPKDLQEQLLFDRDPHGNVQVSHIQTEKLLSNLVGKALNSRSFRPVHHFFGYEGRAALPSNFDATYCYALGHVAAALIHQGYTGYMSCLRGLTNSPRDWEVCGVPLTSLMRFEERKGKRKAVIEKTLVDLDGSPFHFFARHRKGWSENDHFCYPGPLQFAGDPAMTDVPPLSLRV